MEPFVVIFKILIIIVNIHIHQDVHSEHLFTYRHLTVFRDGIDCLKYLGRHPDHVESCDYFHGIAHWKNTMHPFREPCPFTLCNCSKYVNFIQNSNVKGVNPD